MKKRVKSLLGAMLIPLAAANLSARNNWTASWEFSYQDESFATENQVEFQSPQAFIGGSITAQEGVGDYGLTMNSGAAHVAKGNFKGKPQKSYFNGINKQRDNDFYAGFRLHGESKMSEKELFGGAKLKKMYLSSAERTDGLREHKAYVDLGGRVLGIANERREDARTTGVYYIKGDVGGQVNFMPNNPGSRLTLRNILAKTEDFILHENERLDVEFGYGRRTGNTASLGYHMEKDDGLLRRFHFSLGYIEDSSDGTIIENTMTFNSKNPINLRLLYKPETKEASIGLDMRY